MFPSHFSVKREFSTRTPWGKNCNYRHEQPLPLEGNVQVRIVLDRPLLPPELLLRGGGVRRDTELHEEIFDAPEQRHVREKAVLHQIHEPLGADGRPGVLHLKCFFPG